MADENCCPGDIEEAVIEGATDDDGGDVDFDALCNFLSPSIETPMGNPERGCPMLRQDYIDGRLALPSHRLQPGERVEFM